MTQTIGTFSIADLLKSRFTAAEIGFDAINQAVQAELAQRNQAVADALEVLTEQTTDSRRVWGTSRANEMIEVDEFNEADTQQPESGVEIDFPMRRFSYGVGLTSSWLLSAQAADVAQVALDAMLSYERRLQDEIQFAVYNSGNYDFLDKFGDRTTLAGKAFANADSGIYPNMLDGTAVAGTHQHYTGTAGASLANADIDDVIDEVVEHGGMRDVGLYINEGNVATLEALTSTKFTRLTPQVLVSGQGDTIARGNGWIDGADWLKAIANAECQIDKWNSQPVYLECWYEANAMSSQFEYYTKHVTLRPMGGQPSIPYKWQAAKELEAAAEAYGKPLIVLYFGDLDAAGITISETIQRDVSTWSAAPFTFIRCGLTQEQVKKYNVPENIDKPGAYQWEALSDAGANEIITGYLTDYLRLDAFTAAEAKERHASQWLTDTLTGLLPDFQEV